MSLGLISPSSSVSKPCPNFSFSKTHLSKSGLSFKSTRSATSIRATATSTSTVYVNPNTSFYDLLGISETGTLSEIKHAYKQLARKYHPDVSPPDRTKEYTQRFIQVQEAYETLSDPQTRAMYDSNLAAGLYLAFNGRKPFNCREELDRSNAWRDLWESQLGGLNRRSMNRDSWGARMRSQKSAVFH